MYKKDKGRVVQRTAEYGEVLALSYMDGNGDADDSNLSEVDGGQL
jgi:hypothetical protein